MNSISRVFLAISVFMVSSLLGCYLSAEETTQRPVLRAVYGDFSPYSFTNGQGRAEGYSIDLTRQIASRAGYDVRFVAADNPKQFLAMLENGTVDLSPLMALTQARTEVGLATAHLGQFELSVYVRNDSKTVTIEELADQRIGVVVGAITHAVAGLIPSKQVVEFETADAVLLPLLKGEIDAVVAVVEPFEAQLRENFIKDKMRRLNPSLTIIPYGLLVRPELPEVHAALENVIAQMVVPDDLTDLRSVWFGQDRSITEHPWFGNVALIVGGIGLATFSLAIYAVRLRRRAGRLLVENGENGLLIDALDHMRAGVVIFDSQMRAVHWNKGFENRFPKIVPSLKEGATIEQASTYAVKQHIFFPELEADEMRQATAQMIARLQKGTTVQHIVKTPEDDRFDLSMFRLRTGQYAAIWVDITQLHQQQERIASQSGELARKNQQLLIFSSMAAHDLKAPLMQQAALMDILVEDLAEAQIELPQAARDHFATLTDLSRRMNILVGDLLDYAKADVSQTVPICFAPDERLHAVVKLSGNNSHIKIEVAPDMPAVLMEPNAFDIVMRNLISNAIKHHDQPLGHVSLRAHKEGKQVVIEVEDDGPGIADSARNHVFEPFYRITNVEGTGLGLSLVKKTVATWGGSIAIRPAPVRGCIFQILLPAAPDDVVVMAQSLPVENAHISG